MAQQQVQQRELPEEILELVFGNLCGEKKELESCLLICKFWYGLAANIFWENKVIHLLYNSDLIHNTVEFVNLLKNNPFSAAAPIRKIRWIRSYYRESDILDFKFISEQNGGSLEDLELMSNRPDIHLQVLKQEDIQIPHLKRLFVYNTAFYYQVTSLYTSVLYKFRKSLTHIELDYLKNSDNTPSKYGASLYSYLSNFPHLQKLVVKGVDGLMIDLPFIIQYL